QFSGHKFRRFLDVAFMFIERADAGNAEKGLQLVKKTGLIIAGKINCRGSHTLLPFCARARAIQDDRRKRFSIYLTGRGVSLSLLACRVRAGQVPGTQLTATDISQTIGRQPTSNWRPTYV